MTTAIIGSRAITDRELIFSILSKYEYDHIVVGDADGVDELAKRYAIEHDIGVEVFTPDWDHAGSALDRNEEVIDRADRVIAIWDGQSRGTSHGIEYARKKGVDIKVHIPDGVDQQTLERF